MPQKHSLTYAYNCLVAGDDVKRYVAGPPGPPGPAGAPGHGAYRFGMQEVAERALSLMKGTIKILSAVIT